MTKGGAVRVGVGTLSHFLGSKSFSKSKSSLRSYDCCASAPQTSKFSEVMRDIENESSKGPACRQMKMGVQLSCLNLKANNLLLEKARVAQGLVPRAGDHCLSIGGDRQVKNLAGGEIFKVLNCLKQVVWHQRLNVNMETESRDSVTCVSFDQLHQI